MGSSIFEKTQGTQLFISENPLEFADVKLIGAAYADNKDAINNPTVITSGNAITAAMVTAITKAGTWLDGSCATSEISFQGGQKTDVDVTSLCSDVQESFNGLAAPAELTLTRNWAENDPMLAELEDADAADEPRGYAVIFPSGNGFIFVAEIRQNSWSVATAGKVSASYTLRLRGKPVRLHNAKKTT